MGRVVMYASVSVDGFIASDDDSPGPLFDWLTDGDVPLDASGAVAAVATARELAGDRAVEVAAGDVGGQVLAAGLVDEVRMDVVPVVLGSGKRYFGSVQGQHLLEDPDVVIQGDRVLHLR
jgi:dihydrofolate reductase